MKASALLNAVTLDYVEQGQPGLAPIVLLHGYTDSRRSFDRILPRLPGFVHAIAVSMRGHGDSSKPQTGYDIADFADDVAALMIEKELPPAIIVGHSMGGAVAVRLALEYPEMVHKLVLMGTFFKLKDHRLVTELWESTVSTLGDTVPPSVALDFQTSTMAQPVSPWFFDVVVQESLKVPAFVWKSTLASILQSDMSAELTQLRVPTVLMWGNRDPFVAFDEQRRLLASIPNSKLKEYDGLGHSPHWEDPARVAEDLVDLISEL